MAMTNEQKREDALQRQDPWPEGSLHIIIDSMPDSVADLPDLSGYVPTTRTVNGYALAVDVSLAASDVGAPSGSGTSSGTNTGDDAVNSLYSGLVSNATHTGDVTGSAALTLATAQPAVHTWALAQTFTVAPIFTDQAGTRTALGILEVNPVPFISSFW